MKKVLAIVIAVVIAASIGGVAMAKDFDNYKTVGHGALNGPHYNLNIIGVENGQKPDMTGTSGHTIFVPLNGRAKIELYASTNVDLDPTGNFPGPEDIVAYPGCTKDFLVMDRNALDGPAQFCLPVPIVDPDECGEDASEVSYTVYARALGEPNGKSFTTTCATEPISGDIWCSSITMKLERVSGQQLFKDVSKYLLFLYFDGKRYSLFDKALEGYFWQYDNDGLRLAQLRFYENPTCVPDEAPYIESATAECIASNTALITVTGSTDPAVRFDGVSKNDITFFTDAGKDTSISVINGTVSGAGTSLTFEVDVSGATAGDRTLYIECEASYDGSTWVDETLNTIIYIPTCP